MQSRNMFYLTALTIVALFPGANAHAALFCVNNVAALQLALTASESNGENDQIDIVAGTYALSAGRLQFNSSEAASLTVFGGYNADCSQLTTAVTSLNGENTNQLLYIVQSSTSASASVNIERITFIDGNMTSTGAGAMEIYTQGGAVRVETNRFLLNHAANFAGALLIDTAGLITLRNNLFYGNNAPQIGTAELETSNSVAYVTGNTIVDNVANNAAAYAIGGLYLSSNSGTNFWLSNNILWGNTTNDAYDLYASAQAIMRNNDVGLVYGLVQSPLAQGNMTVDPDFMPCGSFLCLGFDLNRSSPLVDAGTDNPPTGIGSTDLAGKPRTIGLHVDIGAFEEDVLFRNGFDSAF